ncbi:MULTISPECIES: Spy/CpxP family protein refolding chaperone [unclassified Chelatococcus]|uniref:Spy/CpxP family protein refolding chaperone n=1 Tax=unclassified Chelatococcus TaxID=2638111 RepID=UPI001BCE935B|nr:MULTISPECIES: Spy/CpxP family protein refolding chaperone [unclassified Chelatococcus]CAH1673356.1 conserved exported hypothetical protein [Hyphomicrobiales bacterium]MBS7738833.1 Spy/CpxP family protein refolding chaperone [Chelatococcus sp. HY11]MBX3547147.1 Spy/CpxP family protein refolding chaperone [Chelatococcus sp.]MCO5076637.1 Spy/CpxP family protein refolding chaperone [Chelatococcus sp.]CAH1674393.1 conserved exported hypothetical protein [Hyphomicrobiales bacterium]
MKRFVPILATAVTLGLASVSMAQAQQPSSPPVSTTVIPGYSDADAKAVLNARLAALKAVIELTPEQENLWPAVENAIRDIAKTSAERRKARITSAPPSHFLDVLSAIADSEEARAKDIKALVAAAKPLVEALSDAQKRRIPAFLGLTDSDGPSQPSGQIWIFEEEEG